jgi:hypothetical protein
VLYILASTKIADLQVFFFCWPSSVKLASTQSSGGLFSTRFPKHEGRACPMYLRFDENIGRRAHQHRDPLARCAGCRNVA